MLRYNYGLVNCSWPFAITTDVVGSTPGQGEDKVRQCFALDRWFSLSPPVSSTNKTDRHDITEILLKVALSTIKPNQTKPGHLLLKLT